MGHKVLIVGPGGGREAALAWKFRQDGDEVFTTNANGGFAREEIATDESGTAITQFEDKKLAEFARKNQIDLAVVAGDDALAQGVADKLRKAGLHKVFGPSEKAAQLESSKAFAKEKMFVNGIPTAAFSTFNETEGLYAPSYIKSRFTAGAKGLVIKASGLAQGKGVVVIKRSADTLEAKAEAANKAISAFTKLKKDFPEAAQTIVIEELLTGKELSAHALADKNGNTVMFPLVADYKQARDGDQGDNTGGMGVVGFLQKGTSEFLEQTKMTIVDPIIQAMKKKGMPFVGLLYPGLMQEGTNQAKVLEYNARFGDPETQVYMRLLDDNCKLFDVLDACITGTLSDDKIRWKQGQHAVSVTLASQGYPGTYSKGKEITGIKDAEQIEGVKVFHAGTKIDDGKLVTSGGRVLHVTATGSTIEEARTRAYLAVEKINFEGKTYRTDIGKAGTRD